MQGQTLTKEEEIASKAKSTVGRGQHPEEETTGVWTGGSWMKRAAQRPRGETRWGCGSSCWADMQEQPCELWREMVPAGRSTGCQASHQWDLVLRFLKSASNEKTLSSSKGKIPAYLEIMMSQLQLTGLPSGAQSRTGGGGKGEVGPLAM